MGQARTENARALAYNIFIISWPHIQAEAARLAAGGPAEPELALAGGGPR